MVSKLFSIAWHDGKYLKKTINCASDWIFGLDELIDKSNQCDAQIQTFIGKKYYSKKFSNVRI